MHARSSARMYLKQVALVASYEFRLATAEDLNFAYRMSMILLNQK